MEKKKEPLGAICPILQSKWNKDYESDGKNAIIRHALSKTQMSEVLFAGESLEGVQPTFSLEVKTLPVADQMASGRCWIFAALNILREHIAKKCKISKFELSQNYISLYDKIEKANYALESIIKLSDREHDDRLFSFILSSAVSDGGQWDMFVNLVHKYGLMPKSAFPETFQSSHTMETTALVNSAIREFAYRAHSLRKEKKDEQIRPLKDQVIEKIYHLYLSSFGVPPKKFDFEYLDAKNVYHIDAGLSPLSFYQKYIGDELLDSYQSTINSPTADKPYGKNFTIDYLGNVVEGKGINHLNVEMKRIKELIIAQLKDGLPVWFGSDVSYFRDRKGFAWDSLSLDYKTPFGLDIAFDKGAMLDFYGSAMNHAMVICGVDIKKDQPIRWKIENSWGEKNGIQGYYVMSDAFFDQFVYQAVVQRKHLSQLEQKACLAEPTHLPPWDPMGTLAD